MFLLYNHSETLYISMSIFFMKNYILPVYIYLSFFENSKG